MVRTHARRSKRRFEQAVDKRSDEERTKEADKIIKNLMASENSAIKSTNEKFRNSGWFNNEDGPPITETQRIAFEETQKETQRILEETLTVCEDCLRIMELQGNHHWRETECDICGENDFCGTFNPEDTIQVGDVYEDEPDISDIPFDNEELKGITLHCNTCDLTTDPKIFAAGELCPKEDCQGRFIFPEKYMFCPTCHENWNDVIIGIRKGCEKCRKEIFGEKTNGKTEKVCNRCFEPWAEPAESTTCSKCNLGGAVSYRMITAPPPDVAPLHSAKPFIIPERRIWVPDYNGPRAPNGKVKLVQKGKETNPNKEEDTDSALYGVMS